MRRTIVTASLILAGCTASDVPGPDERAGSLRVRIASLANPAVGIPDVVCALTLRFDSREQASLRGTFHRGACTGLANPTADARGTFTGSMLSDGTARLTLSPAPLDTSEAVTTSGGCPPLAEAAGPYDGRIARDAIALSSRFRLGCAGLPFPLPPSFDVEYRIED